MAEAKGVAATAKDKAEQKAHEVTTNSWVERLVRFGYIIRGLLYIVVGVLAIEVALGQGGTTTGKGGAIAAIAAQPFGKLLLALTAVGLVGYSLWGFIRAILDPMHKGTDPKGIAQRIGYAVSGLTYGALLIPTVQFLIGSGGGGTSDSQGEQGLTAKLLTAPFGLWIVGIVGIIGMIGGLGQFWLALTAGFKKDLKSGEMSDKEMKLAVAVGRFGMAARGVVFVMAGFFILQVALRSDPKQAKGLDGSLQTLAQQPYGPWLLGIVALGLISFGVYSALSARWIRVAR